MKIWELLADESAWIKELYAKDKNDEAVDPVSPAACKWCVWGAMTKCYVGSDFHEVRLKLMNKIGDNIIRWNDLNKYETIYSTLKELDI